MFSRHLGSIGVLVGLMVSPLLAADLGADKAEIWGGEGATFMPNGTPLDTFQVKVVLTKKENGVIDSEATITKAADGSTKIISQQITPTRPNSFTIESNLGKGGGSCYGEGLCESYVADAEGKAFATTIVHDSKNARRYLTTELEQGKATKIIRQKLTLQK